MRKIKYLSALVALFCAVVSCDPVGDDPIEFKEQQKSIIVYMVANNNLSSYAYNNLAAMKEGYLPTDDNLLVYFHSPDENPLLLKLYKDGKGAPVQDTVYRFPQQNSAEPESLKSVLNISRTMFPAKEYGLILWSHGTGWLPQGYYGKSKSFGQDGTTEMDILELAQALPYKLDFIAFDACLMGGIEVVYQFKDSVDYVISSPAEIMSTGFPYSNIMQHIFRTPMELESVAKEYFDHYNQMVGSSRAATVSVVKTSGLNEVAAQAKKLFEKYGHNGNLDSKMIDTTNVQRYYRSGKHWFYDLNGMMQEIGGEDAADFTNALEKAVVYKAATPEFLGIKINPDKYSGLSTYIPSPSADSTLLEYYSKFLWNRDTGYIIYE